MRRAAVQHMAAAYCSLEAAGNLSQGSKVRCFMPSSMSITSSSTTTKLIGWVGEIHD
jgi:hypothetical protein